MMIILYFYNYCYYYHYYYKQFVHVKISSFQKFVRTRVNGVCIIVAYLSNVIIIIFIIIIILLLLLLLLLLNSAKDFCYKLVTKFMACLLIE